MFITFRDNNGLEINLNVNHIVSIETTQPLAGMQGGTQNIRIFALEGKVYNLDARKVDRAEILAEIERATGKVVEVLPDERPDQDSPLR